MTTFNSSRRKLLERALAFGAVSLLPGCNFDDLKHSDIADDFLCLMSSWNDKVQAALFNPQTLAPTFKPSQITRPPRFNAFYDISQAPHVDVATWRLELSGQIGDKRPWGVEQLRALPQESQITRFV